MERRWAVSHLPSNIGSTFAKFVGGLGLTCFFPWPGSEQGAPATTANDRQASFESSSRSASSWLGVFKRRKITTNQTGQFETGRFQTVTIKSVKFKTGKNPNDKIQNKKFQTAAARCHCDVLRAIGCLLKFASGKRVSRHWLCPPIPLESFIHIAL